MKMKGVWGIEAADEFLRTAIIPLRLSVLDRSGFPLPVSLWFLFADGHFWCATKQDAAVVQCLRRDPRCGFEVAADAPPYRGVRGVGRASLVADRGGDVLVRLLERYSIDPLSRLSQELLKHADREIAIRVEPDWITSWDFSVRMADALKN